MEFIKSVKNKSLIIFLISVLFFFCFNCNVFATTYEPEDVPNVVFDKLWSVVSLGEHGFYYNDCQRDSYANKFLVFTNNNKTTYLFQFYENGYIDTSTTKLVYSNSNELNKPNYFWIEIPSDGSSWQHSTGGDRGYYYYSSGQNANIWYSQLIYSSSNINDQNNNLLFQAPPQLIIPQVVEVNQLGDMVWEAVKFILPIALSGLVIFLLIYLTRRVILRFF